MTKASENLKRSYPVTSDMLSIESPAPIQVQVSTNFLTKRHYFTVFDVMPRDRHIFSSTVEPIIWEIVDLCNNNLNMKQINTNLKTRSYSQRKRLGIPAILS